MIKQNKFALRFGCCVNMITKTKNVSGIDVVTVLKELGFDYTELSVAHVCAMSETEFVQLKSELLKVGLPVESCNNFFPAEVSLTGPNIDKDKIIGYLNKAFYRALELVVRL